MLATLPRLERHARRTTDAIGHPHGPETNRLGCHD